MPLKGPRVCKCGKTVASHIVCECQRASRARYEANRPSARQRGYTSRWQIDALAFLALPANRLCACGCGRTADMVDHIIPHKGDMRLFWNRANWQALASSPCHSSRKQSIERRELAR